MPQHTGDTQCDGLILQLCGIHDAVEAEMSPRGGYPTATKLVVDDLSARTGKNVDRICPRAARHVNSNNKFILMQPFVRLLGGDDRSIRDWCYPVDNVHRIKTLRIRRDRFNSSTERRAMHNSPLETGGVFSPHQDSHDGGGSDRAD